MQASAEQEFKGARAPDETVARAYKFADLSCYPFKKRFLIRAAGVAFFLLIKLIGRTIRWQVEGWENWKQPTPTGGFLFMLSGTTEYFWRRISFRGAA